MPFSSCHSIHAMERRNLGQARLAKSQSAEPTLDAWAVRLGLAQVVLSFPIFVSNWETSNQIGIVFGKSSEQYIDLMHTCIFTHANAETNRPTDIQACRQTDSHACMHATYIQTYKHTCLTLHYITLHYITLRYVALH